jgi:ketosteroid isomerase-like protein
MAHPNIDLFQRVYAAFTSGDMETLADYFAEDVVWHTSGQDPLAGTYGGGKPPSSRSNSTLSSREERTRLKSTMWSLAMSTLLPFSTPVQNARAEH